ncbi:hypothetical protein [Latilactobacillus sakei]|uniref:hypothetical protein n=1 Tax=Latilactobacillus sakei TaxID=1599 RepID=UPI0005074BF8|nr:hypothetical protein KY41_10565 [Latilactobacillus sakei]
MEEEKDYGKLNDELLGILATYDGNTRLTWAHQPHHSKAYNITQYVASELAKQAPEVLNSVQMQYLIVAESPNELFGKLVKYLINTNKPYQADDGKWRLGVPMWKSHES